MKNHPLEIENIGEDVYTLMSRGHHDPHEFMKRVREEGYTWPLGMPQHLWFRATPDRSGKLVCRYSVAEQGSRGAFPVTFATEAPNEELYESVVAASATA